jgi:hypothetical protein
MRDFTKVYTVNNIMEVCKKIEELERDGYFKEDIFVLTHDKKRTDDISEQTVGHGIGVADEGILTTIANLFRSTADGLRAKLRAMGVSKEQAERLESEMDRGLIVVLGWTGTTYHEDNYDEKVSYFNYMPIV